MLLNKICNNVLLENVPGFYQNGGSLYAADNELMISNLSLSQLQKEIKNDKLWRYDLCSNLGLSLLVDKKEKINTDSVEATDNLFSRTLASWPKKNAAIPQLREVKPKKNYSEGDLVPVEITKIDKNFQNKETRIYLKTINPKYNEIEGELLFDADLRIFSHVYKSIAWGNVMKVGQRFNAVVNPMNNTFSITSQFLDYLHELVYEEDTFDANNNIPKKGRLKGREFWTDCGCMVYVDLADAEEEAELEENFYDAVIEIIEPLTGKYDGCFKGKIVGFDVEHKNVQRDEYSPQMLKEFIYSISDINLDSTEEKEEKDNAIELPTALIKEFCFSLNILQKCESNPLLRFRQLCAIRMICKMTESEDELGYFKYISEYIKILISFAHADTDEGRLISSINAPESILEEENIENGREILNIRRIGHFAG